jgi:DNA repair protein RadC
LHRWQEPSQFTGADMKFRKAVLRWENVRVADCAEHYNKKVTTSSEVAKIIHSLIGDMVSESVIILMLDTKLKVMGFFVAAQGSIGSCPAEISSIFREAIAAGAPRIIMAHNHPSDDPVPGEDDIQITAKVKAAGEILGIELVDHIITTFSGKYFSFMDAGLFGKETKHGKESKTKLAFIPETSERSDQRRSKPVVASNK